MLLWLTIALQASLTLAYSLTRHYELKSSGIDGISFAQLLHNVILGHGLISSIAPPYVIQHWFGVHFSPVLYLLAPVYALFPHIETLLVVHSLMIALAAWPLFLAARRLPLSSGQSYIVALFYLCNPFTINAGIWDFHEIAFAPLCIAAMLYALVSQKKWMFIALALALVAIKEHYGLAVAGFGLLWAWHWRDWRFGGLVALAGAATFITVLFIIMPAYSPNGNALMLDAHSEIDRFSWLYHPFSEQSPLPILLREGMMYLLLLLIPLLFFPLTAPLWLLPAAADMAANILASIAMMRSPFAYHSAALIPIFTLAAAIAIAHRPAPQRMPLLSLLAFLTATSCYMNNALPLLGQHNPWEFGAPRMALREADAKALADINAMLPESAAVSAQNNISPHLALRYKLYHFPEQIGDAGYIILNFNPPYRSQEGVLITPYHPGYFTAAEQLLRDHGWAVAYFADGWLVMKKDGREDIVARKKATLALQELKNVTGEQ